MMRRVLLLSLAFVALVAGGTATHRDWLRSRQNQRFFEAARDGNVEKLKSLLKSGVSLETRLGPDQGDDVYWTEVARGTALIWAAHDGQTRVVRFLLKRGANVNAVDELGFTALDKASDPAIIRLLVKAGGQRFKSMDHSQTSIR